MLLEKNKIFHLYDEQCICYKYNRIPNLYLKWHNKMAKTWNIIKWPLWHIGSLNYCPQNIIKSCSYIMLVHTRHVRSSYLKWFLIYCYNDGNTRNVVGFLCDIGLLSTISNQIVFRHGEIHHQFERNSPGKRKVACNISRLNRET